MESTGHNPTHDSIPHNTTGSLLTAIPKTSSVAKHPCQPHASNHVWRDRLCLLQPVSHATVILLASFTLVVSLQRGCKCNDGTSQNGSFKGPQGATPVGAVPTSTATIRQIPPVLILHCASLQ
ncbi:hypothetical protein BCR44DRAFT_35191 [Catenaria anguillulae PL171]|uniref:Uncharacterized protein n=1 Tax=Catenaria anguillulae PL171 TaxID=765915 RepID=A0A1Y2H812_9FUNG|nr:hypothetical protein BCR44DRAFT_35191 [Catenaria anguillulae PL171]